MFEREGIYELITYVGNKNKPTPPEGLYHIKGDSWEEYKERKRTYQALEAKRDRWFGETKTVVTYLGSQINKAGRWRKCKRSALRFFLRSDEWCDTFIEETFGNVQAAYWKMESKDELAGAYLQWFQSKKERMRKSMTDELEVMQRAADITRLTGRQMTHGGVANLLKVLTRTMEKQNADIRSIAKMQYMICRQAGILIPDEFIEDVAVIVVGDPDKV